MKKILIMILVFVSQISFAQSGWQWVNPKPAHESIKSIQFVDQNLVWAVGEYGLIMRSTNEGLSWIIISRDSNNSYNKNTVYLSNYRLYSGKFIPGQLSTFYFKNHKWRE